MSHHGLGERVRRGRVEYDEDDDRSGESAEEKEELDVVEPGRHLCPGSGLCIEEGFRRSYTLRAVWQNGWLLSRTQPLSFAPRTTSNFYNGRGLELK